MVAQRFQSSNLDSTKLVDLDVDLVATATTRTITMPDRDGTLFEAQSNFVTDAGTFFTANNVEDVLQEVGTQLAALNSTTGDYQGSAATLVALDALGGDNGDWAILNADDGANQRGIYVTDGTNYTIASEMVDLLDASETQSGIAQFATAADVAAGTANNLTVSPANLSTALGNYTLTTDLAAAAGAGGIGIADAGGLLTSTTVEGALQELAANSPVAATDAIAGVVELATQAEVDAGTDATRAITPVTLAGALTSYLPTTLNAGQVWIGSAGNEATGQTLSGDVTIDNAGAATVIDATTTVAGKVELATVAETAGATLATVAVTPAGLSGLILEGAAEVYTTANVTVLRNIDADAITHQSLADIVGSLIGDLQTRGILA